MVTFQTPVTLLVMATCLPFILAEDMRSADAAISKSCDSRTKRTTQQQQQHLQQISSRYSHLATDLQALFTNKIDNPYRYTLTDLDKTTDNILNFPNSVGTVAGTKFSSSGQDIRFQRGGNIASFRATAEHIDPESLVDKYPVLDGKAMLTSSLAPFLSPYMYIQEFQKLFTKSNPYFSRKSTINFSPENEFIQLGDKRVAPKFVKRRELSNFSDELGNPIFQDNYLSEFTAETDIQDRDGTRGLHDIARINGTVHFFQDKRGPPKFVGKRMAALDFFTDENGSLKQKRAASKFISKRRAPYFVGKRGPPQFFGHRFRKLHYPHQDLFDEEDERGSLASTGRRGPTYFSDKRDPPMFVGKRVYEVDVTDDQQSLLGERRASPTFVGRRAAPYFVGRRAAPYFVGKRGPSRSFLENVLLL